MKILIISDLIEIEKDFSIPSVIWDFTKSFMELGHNVSVIRPNFLFNSYLRGRKFLKSGEYVIDNIKIYNRNFLLPFLFENKKFINFLQSRHFDLIISHMPSGHIYASLINRFLKTKHAAILHNSDYRIMSELKYGFYFKNRLKSALKSADIIGARNKTLSKKMNADFILPSFFDKKYIIDKKKKLFDGKKLKIITLSRLIKRKNIDLIIKTLSGAEFDFEYSIFGKGKEQKKLQKLINKYDLKDKIKIYPYIEHNLIYNLLDNYDVFVLLSNNETFGLSYLEALARGLIVIGSKNEGIDGILENNKNGFLINPNKDELIQKLNDIYKFNSAQKQKLSQNAINTAKNYTKEHIMEEYLKQIARI